MTAVIRRQRPFWHILGLFPAPATCSAMVESWEAGPPMRATRPKRTRAMRERSPSELPILAFAAAFLAAAGAMASTAPLAAQSPSITVPQVSCFRFADNQVLRATTLGEPGGATA